MTGEVHRIAARRAARQRITVAGGPDLSIRTLGPARIESPLATLLDARQGFIACYAALARNNADVMLIPEVTFQLDGDSGLLHHVQRRVRDRGYAVVVVAEGAGQELLDGDEAASDASGNAGLRDVGGFLRRRHAEHFAAAGIDACIRFIDPSYAIRSVPANPYDSVYCVRLAQAAVHAAMSGRTEMVGWWRRRFVRNDASTPARHVSALPQPQDGGGTPVPHSRQTGHDHPISRRTRHDQGATAADTRAPGRYRPPGHRIACPRTQRSAAFRARTVDSAAGSPVEQQLVAR